MFDKAFFDKMPELNRALIEFGKEMEPHLRKVRECLSNPFVMLDLVMIDQLKETAARIQQSFGGGDFEKVFQGHWVYSGVSFSSTVLPQLGMIVNGQQGTDGPHKDCTSEKSNILKVPSKLEPIELWKQFNKTIRQAIELWKQSNETIRHVKHCYISYCVVSIIWFIPRNIDIQIGVGMDVIKGILFWLIHSSFAKGQFYWIN